MRAIRQHLVACMLLVSGALAQSTAGTTATVENVTVARDGSGLRVEVTLSSPVQPSVETAINPDRILLDFPGTITNSKTEKEIHMQMEYAAYARASTAACLPVTRVVLDLDQARSYTTRAEGNRIIITVGPLLSAKSGRSAGPAPPVSLGLGGIFRRKTSAPQSTTADESPSISLPTSSAPTSASPSTSGPVKTASDRRRNLSGNRPAPDAKPHDGSVSTGGFPSAGGDTPSAPPRRRWQARSSTAKADGTSRTTKRPKRIRL